MSTQFTNRQWRLPNNENKDKQSNYSMDFSGTEYITGGTFSEYISSLNPTTLTVSAWIKTTDTGTNRGIIGSAFYTSGLNFYVYNGEVSFGISATTTTSTTTANVNDGNWHHVVGTYDSQGDASGNTLYIYVDGIQKASNTVVKLYTRNDPLFIGAKGVGSSTSVPFIGQIDGVAIFDYALSSSQVTTLYGSSSTGIGNPMTLNPVAYYPLGDQDAFNGANYLVPNSSLKDYVFDFDGSSGQEIAINDNTLIDGYTSVTFSFWFKGKSGLASFDGLLCQRSSDYTLIHAHSVSGNNYKILIQQSGGGYARQDSSTLELDKWYHVCVKGTVGSIWNIYINGQLSNSYGSAQNISGIVQNTNPFQIGKDANSAVGEFSNVQIFNTELPAIGSNSVETLYNNGSPLTSMSGFTSLQGWWKLDASATYDSSTTTWTIPDDSTNSNDGTSSGMTQANLVQSDLSFTSGYSPYALDFDSASSDYIDCGASLFSSETEISVSGWIYPTSTGTGSAEAVLSTEKTSSTLRGFYLSLFINNEFRWQVSTNGSSKDSLDAGTILLNQWSHITATWNQSTMNLYVNGSLAGTMNTVNATGTFTTTNNIFIAKRDSSAGFFPGSISNASIWNAALTPAQVTEIYNEGVPSNLNNHSAYSNLVSWWQLGSNTSWVDPYWIALDEKGTNNGQSQNVAAPNNMGEDAIVDGVGSYANGLSHNMGGDEVIGDAPYSTANSLSVNMDVEDRVTDTPS